MSGSILCTIVRQSLYRAFFRQQGVGVLPIDRGLNEAQEPSLPRALPVRTPAVGGAQWR